MVLRGRGERVNISKLELRGAVADSAKIVLFLRAKLTTAAILAAYIKVQHGIEAAAAAAASGIERHWGGLQAQQLAQACALYAQHSQ